jgi:hypothetical protein
MKKESCQHSNLDALEIYWRRLPFHDEAIESVVALNRRAVIRLRNMTLVVTGASSLKRCDLPAIWLYESITRQGGNFVLDVETDTGHLVVAGADVRLIRNSDLAMLVPPVDGEAFRS